MSAVLIVDEEFLLSHPRLEVFTTLSRFTLSKIVDDKVNVEVALL